METYNSSASISSTTQGVEKSKAKSDKVPEQHLGWEHTVNFMNEPTTYRGLTRGMAR